jgi:adenylate cyclase
MARPAIAGPRAPVAADGSCGPGSALQGEPWIPVGIGVHTGLSYVGYIGEGDALDFTALGDTVNTAARLTSMAKTGEIVISNATVSAAGLDTSGLERRTLELRGREQSVDAWVQPAMSSVETTAA